LERKRERFFARGVGGSTSPANEVQRGKPEKTGKRKGLENSKGVSNPDSQKKSSRGDKPREKKRGVKKGLKKLKTVRGY